MEMNKNENVMRHAAQHSVTRVSFSPYICGYASVLYHLKKEKKRKRCLCTKNEAVTLNIVLRGEFFRDEFKLKQVSFSTTGQATGAAGR